MTKEYPTPQSDSSKLYVELREFDAHNSAIKISGLPADSIAIKIDQYFKAPDTIFTSTRGQCKRADYIIISEEKKCILYIEIKETKGKNQDIINQLRGAQCFVGYCREIVKSFWGNNTFLVNYKHRFICIGYTSSDKRSPAVQKIGDLHDSPEKMLRVKGPSHQFNQLARLKGK